MRKSVWIVAVVLAVGCMFGNVVRAQSTGEDAKNKKPGASAATSPKTTDPAPAESKKEAPEAPKTEEPNADPQASGTDNAPVANPNAGGEAQTPSAPTMTEEEFQDRITTLRNRWKEIGKRFAAVKERLDNLPAEQLVKFEQATTDTENKVADYENNKIPALIVESDAVVATTKAGKLGELAQWFEEAKQKLLKIAGK